MNNIVTIFGIQATGSFVLYPLEGEVVRGFVFRGIDEAFRLPINSILLKDVDPENMTISVVVSTLCHGLFVARIHAEDGATETTPLPSPSHPITAMSLMKSEDAVHVTQSNLKQELPCKRTLVATLSDNTVVAYGIPAGMTRRYDLTEMTVNREYSLLTWLLPSGTTRNVDVFTNVICYPAKRAVLLVSRDCIVVCGLSVDKVCEDMPERAKNVYFSLDFNPFDRLMR